MVVKGGSIYTFQRTVTQFQLEGWFQHFFFVLRRCTGARVGLFDCILLRTSLRLLLGLSHRLRTRGSLRTAAASLSGDTSLHGVPFWISHQIKQIITVIFISWAFCTLLLIKTFQALTKPNSVTLRKSKVAYCVGVSPPGILAVNVVALCLPCRSRFKKTRRRMEADKRTVGAHELARGSVFRCHAAMLGQRGPRSSQSAFINKIGSWSIIPYMLILPIEFSFDSPQT